MEIDVKTLTYMCTVETDLYKSIVAVKCLKQFSFVDFIGIATKHKWSHAVVKEKLSNQEYMYM